jgi:hypothetical protein
MGGGGTIYDRDTKDGQQTTTRGFTTKAEEIMSRSNIDKDLLPKGRRIVSQAKNPIVNSYDVTSSMDSLPLIIVDKAPLIVGQIVENGYLKDPEFSLAAIGDVRSDSAPMQVCDFCRPRKLDDWLKRIWRENGGGGNGGESYEMMAYFYARYCDIPKAEVPFFLITGDEHFRDTLSASVLRKHFGGEHETVDAQQIFDELKKKFMGNVFLIHRPCAERQDQNETDVIRQWREALGDEHVILLTEDKAIADVTLGIFAIMTGTKSLDEYLDDMKTKRDKAQSNARIARVRASLEPLVGITPTQFDYKHWHRKDE